MPDVDVAVEHRLQRFDRNHPPSMLGPRAKPTHKGRVTAGAKRGGGLSGVAYGCTCSGILFGAASYTEAVRRHRDHVADVARQAELDARATAALADELLL